MYVDRAESQAACRLPVIAIIGGGYSGAAAVGSVDDWSVLERNGCRFNS